MRKNNDLFASLLANLADTEAPLKGALIYRLSEPLPNEMAALQSVWPSISDERRSLLMARLAETSETSFEVDFSEVALFALQDTEATVRQHAIEALWENEQPGVMRQFVSLMLNDPDMAVRAAAATALGRFVLLGELEEMAGDIVLEAEEALVQICQQPNQDLEVHRRALESLAYSRRKEVIPFITQASEHENVKMQASALFAMGRNGDPRWIPNISSALQHDDPELRYEAARAAGEIGLTQAVPRLIQLAHSQDRDIKEIAIWSLGEIGGNEAQNALFEMADSETEPGLAEAIEDALNMATLSLGDFGLVVLPADDEEDFEGLEDIDEEQDTP
jgi:hypothetical protein